jgi:GntR family transcriptional repressor for pyruvate dehydrogenase complex
LDHGIEGAGLEINFAPVERSTVSEEISKQLISLINAGKLRPGDKLPSERELMEKFQVSRSSIREALHNLTMMGLVETTPGAGTFVSQHLVDVVGGQIEWSILLGNRDLMELMEVREPLEIQATGLAAERASAQDVAVLRETIDDFAVRTVTGEGLMEAEMAVHLAIANATGNTTLARILQIFQTLLRDYRKSKKLGFSPALSGVDEYQEILKAIESGDADAARSGMARHLYSSRLRATAEQLREHSETQS